MLIRRPRAGLAVMLALPLLALALTAHAGDLCIDSRGFGGGTPDATHPIVIARSFRIPGRNKCKQVTGVIVPLPSAVTGTACTSFDGDHVTFVLAAAVVTAKTGPFDLRGFSTVYTARIYVGSLQGGLAYTDALTNTTTNYFAIAYECKDNFHDNL